MKIKLDFVTNSSTTSFVVYGVELSDSDLMTNLILALTLSNINDTDNIPYAKGKNVTVESICKMVGEDGDIDYIQNVFRVLGIEIERDWDSGYSYAGVSPFSIGDNETGAEFRQKVKERLASVGITKEPTNIEIEIGG